MAPRVYIRSIDREYPALRSSPPRARQPFRHAKFGRSCAIDVATSLRVRRSGVALSWRSKGASQRTKLSNCYGRRAYVVVSIARVTRVYATCFFGFAFSSDIVARNIGSTNLLALWMDDFLITTRPWIFVRLMGNGKWEGGKFHRT